MAKPNAVRGIDASEVWHSGIPFRGTAHIWIGFNEEPILEEVPLAVADLIALAPKEWTDLIGEDKIYGPLA